MAKTKYPPARLWAGALASVLMLAGLLVRAWGVSTGAPAVILSDMTCTFSRGADGTAAVEAKTTGVFELDLTLPGSWALVIFTAENIGTVPARLTDVSQEDGTGEDLTVQFGISPAEAGEILEPGEHCTVSMLIRRDDSARSGDPGGTVALRLTYGSAGSAAENRSPATGDAGIAAVVLTGIGSGAALLGLTKRRKRHHGD